MAAGAISQISCFSSINRGSQYRLQPRSYPSLRSKVLVVMSNDERATDMSRSQIKTALSYTEDASKSQNGSSLKSYPADEVPKTMEGESKPIEEPAITQQKRAAKIHDFCLGIPFGGLVLCGGLGVFIFSGNHAILRTGVFFGAPLLALSFLSLKVWRKGNSSLPFMLGQAALAAGLMWKSVKTYSLSKMIFPTGFYAVISAVMLCFYTYVLLSGGNPPPKKTKAAAVESL